MAKKVKPPKAVQKILAMSAQNVSPKSLPAGSNAADAKTSPSVMQDQSLVSSNDGKNSQDSTGGDDKGINDPFAEYDGILNQIKREWTYSWTFIQPKWDKWLVRLKLYNNQKRNVMDIGDPLLFTILQTWLASMYSDELTVAFRGRNVGDDDQAETQTQLAQYDAGEMRKAELDYTWMWHTGFFGRGLILLNTFDVNTKTPLPENIDPLTFLRDPDCTNICGDRLGRGSARFFGREIRVSQLELEQHSDIYKNIQGLPELSDDNKITPVQNNLRIRQSAAGYDVLRQAMTGDNAAHILVEWFTHWNGKKVIVTCASNFNTIIRVQEIELEEWPIAERTLFPTADDYDGVSICDLVEDKQRARAKIINLSLKGVEAGVYPDYIYNNQLIKNKAALAKIEFNKYTGVPGNPNNAIVQIERKQVSADVNWMLSLMDTAAQKSTATSDIQQGGMTDTVRSATEIENSAQGADNRYSLAQKIFGWSEKRFWRLWYKLYDIYFAPSGIDSKVLRLEGPLGSTWKTITREDVIGEEDPDIYVESKKISDADKMNRVNMLMGFMNQGVAMDPGFNKRFALKQIGRAMTITEDELNRFLPQTFDEYEAEEENLLLNQNKLPKISISQNHMVHIEIHTKAVDNTARAVHIKMHQVAMFAQQKNPQLMQQPGQAQPGPGGPPGAPPAGQQPAPTQPAPGQPLPPGAVPLPGPGQQPPAPMSTGATPSPRAMAQDAIPLAMKRRTH